MKTKYALMNAKGEFFSHFTEWQGLPHANWNSTKVKLFDSLPRAKEKAKELKNICFCDVQPYAVVLHKRQV